MSTSYDPKQYWEKRLSNCFSPKGVGHINYSENYNRWLYRRKERCIASTILTVSLAGKQVLDIGCGTGFFVEWYMGHKATVCGIDITETSVERLRKKFGTEFHVQDISDPHYRPRQLFDIVNMWDVMYHIVAPDAFERALSNIVKSLKPGGLLLFTDWFGAPSDIRMGDHVQGRCLDTYDRALSGRELHLVGIYPLYGFLNKPHLGRLDNYLGWLYFALDNRRQSIPSDNISLGVWRYGNGTGSQDSLT